jgi:hypothetical protein
MALQEKAKRVAQMPLGYYLFNREAYEKTRKGGISFII